MLATDIVLGPASSVNNNVALFNGTTGKAIQAGAAAIGTLGAITLANTTASTTTGTGAFICAGGVGIAGDANFGGILTAANSLTSSAVNNGALVSSGGLGVNKDSYFGGSIDVLGNTIIGPNQTRILDTKLTMQGTTTSITGPHETRYVSGNQYPVFQQLNWATDNVSLNFDSYFSGSAWTSSYLSSNYQIQKTSSQLQFN